jgi:hypothetical protein
MRARDATGSHTVVATCWYWIGAPPRQDLRQCVAFQVRAQSLAVTAGLAARVLRLRFFRFLAIGAACRLHFVEAMRISGAIA